MAEWSKAAVLKTADVRASGGSNPSLRARRTLMSSFFVLLGLRPKGESLSDEHFSLLINTQLINCWVFLFGIDKLQFCDIIKLNTGGKMKNLTYGDYAKFLASMGVIPDKMYSFNSKSGFFEERGLDEYAATYNKITPIFFGYNSSIQGLKIIHSTNECFYLGAPRILPGIRNNYRAESSYSKSITHSWRKWQRNSRVAAEEQLNAL